MTTAQLNEMLDSPDHHGYGYACVRRYHGDAFAGVVDRLVVQRANLLQLTTVQVFMWANSQWARWLSDSLSVSDLSEIEKYLTPGIIESLTQELVADMLEEVGQLT